MQADLILENANIHTLWEKMPQVEAVAIAEGRFAAVGPDALGLKGAETKVIDLAGCTVIPGMIDAHNHLVDYGIAKLRSANLLGSRSISEIIHRLDVHRCENGVGQWILGHCFDQELLTEQRFPTKEDLDRAFGATPVLITRVCGHACVVSSSVLTQITDDLPETERRTGILTEGRAALAWGQIPSLTRAELKRAAMAACEEARSRGLTGVHCVVGDAEEFAALQKLHEEKRLPVRIYAILPQGLHLDASEQGLRTGSGDEWLKIGGVKFFMDGSMGARTAAMHDEFADDPGNRGELMLTGDQLAEEVSRLQEQGFQAVVHAIGDLAVDEAASGISKALDGRDNRVHRHRIEHASMMSEFSLKKMAENHIIGSVQPQFVVSDFWTIERIGHQRYRYAYPFKTMLNRGITLAMGSDCPVEIISPFKLIQCAATRDIYSHEERLYPWETLRAYSLGSAYAAFEEDIKGSISPGKLADFLVLSQDIFDVDDVDTDSIEATRVLTTCVGGQFYPEV